MSISFHYTTSAMFAGVSAVSTSCGAAATGNLGDYQNVRAIIKKEGVKNIHVYVLWGGTTVL